MMSLCQCECGGTPECVSYYRDTSRYCVEWWFVFCPVCKTRTRLLDTLYDSVGSWNQDFGVTKPGFRRP